VTTLPFSTLEREKKNKVVGKEKMWKLSFPVSSQLIKDKQEI